ncbi:MAG: DUF4434 domain-containing protein [Chitinispirillales bacterium]|jgi:hypothetical protein|nr:DUF4434 domain-containing protein [Chitinispirillales bacterium]
MAKKHIVYLLFAFITIFASKNPQISGFFIQPCIGYGVADYQDNFKTQQFYNDWVKSMSDIGANMLFYQWVSHYEANQEWFSNVYGGAASADFCFYYPNLIKIDNISVNSWMPAIKAWTLEDVSPIQRVLDAGEKNNVKIWLGLYLNEDGTGQTFNWWEAVNNNDINSKDSAIFRYHVRRSVDLVKDLALQFGNHSAFGGFYYSVEIANLGFENRENWDILAWLLDSVATEVHNLSNKQLAISPFFNTTLTPAKEYGEMWDYVLSKSSIDIIMLQDGVGVKPQILTETVDLVSPYFEAVKKACDKNGKSFWANSELFTNYSGDDENPEFSSSNIDKILLQMNTEAEFADTFVCFSYLSLDPFSVTTPFNEYPLFTRKKLYNDYKTYYDSIKNENNSQTISTIKSPKSNLLDEVRISVSGLNIAIPKMQKPMSYCLVSPNGKVVLSGTVKDACVIKVPVSYGIYIFMLGFENQTSAKQKIFLQKDISSTIYYKLHN